MNRIPVTSSNLASAGYDDSSQTMEIEFNNGALYQYFDVPDHVYQELIASSSAGTYFHAQVRGVYRYARA